MARSPRPFDHDIDFIYVIRESNHSVVFLYSSIYLANERFHTQKCHAVVHFSGTSNQITVYCDIKGLNVI